MTKLVRDLIPEIIRTSGKECKFHIADGWEYKERLMEKMAEEVQEFWTDPGVEEAADVYEVFMTWLWAFQLSFEDVVQKAGEKRSARGGFREGYVLHEVTDEN